MEKTGVEACIGGEWRGIERTGWDRGSGIKSNGVEAWVGQ